MYKVLNLKNINFNESLNEFNGTNIHPNIDTFNNTKKDKYRILILHLISSL